MKQIGQIALAQFPSTDLETAKLRPVLLLRESSTRHNDWLVCMVSSRLHQQEEGIDERLMDDDPDFAASGLKIASVIRLSRLAVLEGRILVGAIGALPDKRLRTLKQRLADWIIHS